MAFSKNVLLLFTLLLSCGHLVSSFQERGQSSQRRRTAIGESITEKSAKSVTKSTKAPTAVIDQVMEDVGLLGSKSKGKGSKSEKSEKSTKSFKGFELSMSMSLELGKGTKTAKGTKTIKSLKSEKGSKKVKKDSKGDKASFPGLVPATPPPTSANSISEKSWPYAITYGPMMDIPSSKDLMELTMLTQKYLDDFMADIFEKTSLTELDNFLTIMVKDAFIEGEPVSTEYQSNGLFSPNSIFTPTKREINSLIEDAVTKQDYLKMVQALPKSNPFSQTKTITYTTLDNTVVDKGTNEDVTDTSSGEKSSSSVRAGVAAAAAGVVLLAAGLAVLRSRKSSTDDNLDDEVEDFSAHKMTSEDSTIAGETCILSVDDSTSHFAHWRAAKAYNQNASDFVDEALDSDDECHRMATVENLS